MAGYQTASRSVSKVGDKVYGATVADEETRMTLQASARELGWTNLDIHEGGAEAAIDLIAGAPNLDLLVVDISDSHDPLVAMAAVAGVCHAETKVVALGRLNDVCLYRALLEMGVSDYLVKPISRGGLSKTLRKVTSAEPETPSTGRPARQIAIIGSRGGVGVTTLTVSAAWALSQRQNVALLDLDPQFGNVGLSLDLPPGRGLRELLANPERLDNMLVTSAMTQVSDNLRVLGGGDSLESTAGVAPVGLAALLADLRTSADYIVVDTPRTLDPASRAMLEMADVVVVVTDQSLAGMRDTHKLLRLVGGMGGKGEILVVANKAGGVLGEVGRADFERGIETKISLSISHDSKAAMVAAQLGKAFCEVAKSPKTIAELQIFAVALGPNATATPGTSFMKRVLGR